MSAHSRRGAFVCQSCLTNLRKASEPLPRAHLAGPVASRSKYSTTSQRPSTARPRLNTSLIPKRQTSAIRRYSSTEVKSSYPALAAAKGLAPLPVRRLISLSGPDAAKFLQGLVAQNVVSDRQAPFYTAFLDARGRILWDVFIWTYPGLAEKEWACYIEVDAAEADNLQKHLKKHKLRSKIAIKTVPEGEVSVFAGWGFAQDELQHPSLIASLEDTRAPGFGVRFLLSGEQSSSSSAPPVPMLDLDQYVLRRYLFGIPEGQAEIPRESSLPMEMNIDLSSGIDFRKGCYVGQELTIRTKHTGVVRKRILPIQLYHAHDPAPPGDSHPDFDATWSTPVVQGADIKQLDAEGSIRKGRAAGKYIAGVGNVGLALCRVEMMTGMRVSAEGGSWRPGMEFALQSNEADEPVRIKAMVPTWFMERERAMWGNSKGRMAEPQ